MERQRVEKEKEIARLRAMQERAKDKQAEKVHVLSYSVGFVLLYDSSWISRCYYIYVCRMH